MTRRDIVDDIDALIDEQLDAGEPIGGYDYNDPDYPKCWHCGRDWHGLPITERMNEMRWRGEMDPDYRYADDTSRVVCPGSKFIGPLPEPKPTEGGCGCTACRAWRSLRSVRAAAEGGAPRWNYPAEGFWPNPLDPATWATLDLGQWREPARWWRLDITAHQNMDEFTFETEGVGVVRGIVGPPGRTTLVVRLADGRTGMTPLVIDPATSSGIYAHYTVDEDRRPLTLDVHAARPHDLGGRIVWNEIDGPGGDYVRSRALISTSRIDQWFGDRGLWFLAPREIGTALDRLLGSVEFVPWQRDLVNRAVNAIRRGDNRPRRGAPYLPAGVSMPQRGDAVGYEIGGRVYTGVVTAIDPGERSNEYSLTVEDRSFNVREVE